MKPRTQSRALQLVIHDMNVQGKPTDQQIAEEWGLADARSVRDVRESEEYSLLLGELQHQALSHVGERALQIQIDAVDALAESVPLLATAVKRMLTPPEGVAHPDRWMPKYTELTAANSAINTLIKLANVTGHQMADTKDTRAQVLPTLQIAESDSAVIRERYSMVVDRIRRDDNAIQGDYEVLQAEE